MQTQRIGRRRKFSNGDRVRGKETAPAEFRDRIGTIVEYGPGKAEYTVRFDDDPNTVTYLQSPWLDLLTQTETAAHQ